MPQSMLDFVVAKLYGADLDAAAKVSGYSKHTLRKIRQGEIPNPGVRGIEALYHHLKAAEVRARRAA